MEIIKKYEGLRLKAYTCPAGLPTIGYGTTYYANGKKVKVDDVITQLEAEKELNVEISRLRAVLALKLPTWKSMNENQQEALISFAYNFGANFYNANGFASISRLIRTPSDWDNKEEVLRVFSLYCKANGKILLGLEKRRREEGLHFLQGGL